MSIITVRSWYEKKGCQVGIGVLMLLVMMGLIGPMFCNSPAMSSDGQQIVEIVKVGGVPATTADLIQVRELTRNGRPSPTNPREAFQQEASDLAALVDLAAGDSLAAKYGVKPSEALAVKAFEESFEMQMFSARIQLQMNGLIKAGATDKEFEEAFEKQTGQKLADYKAQQTEAYKAELKQPGSGALRIRAQAVSAVTEHVALTKTPTEEQLKKSYETLVFNRLAIVDPKLTEEQRKKKTDDAQKALAGGKAYVDVYKEMIGGTTPTPTELPMSQIDSNVDYAPLKNLKPKEAVVITEFGSPVVFQLVTTKTNLPADYEANKAKLMSDFAKNEANKQVQDELKALKEDTAKIVWSSPESALVFDIFTAMSKTPAVTDAAVYKAFVDRVTALEAKADSSVNLLTLAKYVAFEEMFRLSTASEQIGLKEQRAEILSAALDIQDNTTLRNELADMQKDLKLADAAAENLVKAISNTMSFVAADITFIEGIEKKAKDWEKAKFFEEVHMEQINSAMTTWRKDKAAFDKDEAERKAMEEEARKEMEAEQKKLEAEAKEEAKRIEEDEKKKKAATTGSTTGSTGGIFNPPAGATGTTGTTGAATTTGR